MKSEDFWGGGLRKTSDFPVLLHRPGETAKADAAYIFALLRLRVPNLRGFSELPQTSLTGADGLCRPNVRENSKSVGLITRVGSSPTTGTMSSGDNGFELSPLDFFLPSEKENSGLSRF